MTGGPAGSNEEHDPKKLSDRVRRGTALFRQTRNRFGAFAATRLVLHRVANSFMCAESWKIVVRERDDVSPPDPTISARFSCRPATRADLEAMRVDPRLQIGESKLRYFEEGDLCLLSFVDGQIAGYGWARRQGQAELVPGLRLSIPDQYFYDYAALTLPEFRGLGLQAYRLYQLLNSDVSEGKVGLFGFPRTTNFPMRQALAKSGGRTVGSLWLFGTRHHFIAHFSRSARRLGMRRL